MLATALLMFAVTQPTGQIAFLRPGPEQSAQVCVFDFHTGETTVVGPGADDGPPVWAPDGSQLAFESDLGEGKRGIVLATPDGERERIPHYYERNEGPAWSPEGTHIAYSARDVGDKSRLVVYDLATGRETVWGAETRGLMQPVWLGGRALETFVGAAEDYGWREGVAGTLLREASRQGALIATGFVAVPGGLGTSLFVVSQQAAIEVPAIVLASPREYDEWAPATSVREERIAFESNDGGDREIFVLSFRTGTFDLSNHRAADWNPVWTPDLGWLAFESFRTGRRGLFRGNVESVRVEPIAASDSHDNWGISYAPAGVSFAFISNRDGEAALFVQQGYGTSPQRIDAAGSPIGAPAWRPAR